MNILVLGGTQFVGRHIVEAMVSAGHDVTILTRGITPDALSANVEHLRGDRDGGRESLAALGTERTWDACIDVTGYLPGQVQPSAEFLRDRVSRYVFVSAVRTYGDPPHGPVTEDFPTVAPAVPGVTEIDNDTYGPLKVACEQLVQSALGSVPPYFVLR
ncbi:MAG: NAD-dependent epimerase/dehydratase family protein [Armatimonas sp.]